MLRPTQLKTPLPVALAEVMVAPEGLVRVFKETVTLPAALEPASRIRLNATTSLRPPKREIAVPFQTEFATLVPFVARSSSRVTLSSPVFAQIAVIAWAARTGTGAKTKPSIGRHGSKE